MNSWMYQYAESDILTEPFQIDIITSEYEAKECANLLDDILGEGLHSTERFISYATTFGPWAIVAAKNKENKIIAASCCRIADKTDADVLSHYFSNSKDIVKRIPYDSVGLLESSAVLPEYRRRGIATSMIDLRTELLIEYDCNSIMAICWDNGSDSQSLPMFLKLGYKFVSMATEVWDDCPVCIKDCNCPAYLVYKDL